MEFYENKAKTPFIRLVQLWQAVRRWRRQMQTRRVLQQMSADEPELTARALDEEGWYYSGDLCRMDEAGYIKITGRKKDIIVRGGENISSREVEDILLQHPKIHDACVVAMPDERLGERSCAYVVLKAPHHSLSQEEVVAFFSRKRVAKYKYPEHIVVIEKLPRTVSGKIQKFLLRKDIMRRLTQDVCEEIE